MTTSPVLDIVSIDYVRFSTFDFQVYCDLSAKMRRKFVGWRKSRWLQYKMERSQENVAYGLAEQNGKPHGIFEASGLDAHIFSSWLLETQSTETIQALKCSRIDLQSTKRLDPKLDYPKVYKRLRDPKRLILGSDGNTIYIGNRKSDSFWRIYDKSEDCVRVEVELKGRQAQICWNSIGAGNDIAALYATWLEKSRVPKLLVDIYKDGRAPVNEDDLATAVPKDLEKTMLWLQSLDQMFYKMVNDHDYGDRTMALLKRWTEYGQ